MSTTRTPKAARAEKPSRGDKWKNPWLLNWPPSRGPMPPSMRRAPEYVVPEPERRDGEPRRRSRLRIVNTGDVPPGMPAVIETGGDPRPAPRSRLTKAQIRANEAWFRGLRRALAAARKRRPRRPPPTQGTWSISVHVETLGELTVGQAMRVVQVEDHEIVDPRSRRGRLRRQTLRVSRAIVRRLRFPHGPIVTRLDYPLNVPVDLVVRPCVSAGRRGLDPAGHGIMEPAYLLWVLAREYRRIYRMHRHYGVWGHALGDLWFEGIRIRRPGKDGLWRAEIMVGS